MEELFTIPEVLSPRLQWLKDKDYIQAGRKAKDSR